MTAEDLIESMGGLYADCLQKALDKSRKNIVNDSWDLGTLVRNATWSAYCEALEQAIRIVNEVTEAGLRELAAVRAKKGQ
jgi:hypothetical protein